MDFKEAIRDADGRGCVPVSGEMGKSYHVGHGLNNYIKDNIKKQRKYNMFTNV